MINTNQENGQQSGQLGNNSKIQMSTEQKIQQIEERLKSQQEFSVQLIQILDQQTQAFNSLQSIIKIEHFNPNPIMQEIKEKFRKSNIDLSTEQFDKLYERVYCTTATLEPLSILNQIEDKVDAKLDIFREIKTKLLSATTKIEQQNARSLQMEQSITKLNVDLDQKPSKQELKNINEQVKISNSLRLLADKDSVKYLLEKMQNLDRTMEEIVTKKYFEEQTVVLQNQFRQDLLNTISKNYETQAQSLEIQHKAENMHKKFTLQFEKFKEQNTLKIVNMEQLINDSRIKLAQKVEKNEYEEFKQWSNQYVHLSNLNHIYEQLTPMVKSCKKDTDQCIQKLKIFEVFLNNIDETLLFKSEKMELKKLEQFIEENFLQKNEFEKLEQNIKQQHQTALNKFQKTYEDNNKIMFSSTKSQIFPLIKEEIRDQIQKYDIVQDKVADLIDTVQLELKKKADYSHIILLQNDKTSKKNSEQMHKDLKKMNQNLLSMSHNILIFMRQFLPNVESQSLQTRKKEIQGTIENVQTLFEKIHAQNSQINPGTTIVYNNQNSRSISPYERISLAKEIIKQNTGTVNDEDSQLIERKGSKPFSHIQSAHQTQQDNSTLKENYYTQSSNFMTLSTNGVRTKATSAAFNSRPATPSAPSNYKRTPSKGRPLRPLIQIQQQTQNICMQTIGSDHIAQQEIKREMFEEQSQYLQNYYIKNHNSNNIRSKRETSQSQQNQKGSMKNIHEYQNSQKNSISQEFKEQYPQRSRSRIYSNNIDSQTSFVKIHQPNNLVSQQQISEDDINPVNEDEGNIENKKSQFVDNFVMDSHKQIKTCE